MYYVVFDGNCNLCTNLVRLLETLDRGQQFQYVSMQETATLDCFGITPNDCEMGMILIDANNQQRRWQGSAAAEEIGRILPFGELFVNAYRSLPGIKAGGDRVYEYVRDHRYQLFGKRSDTYQTTYPVCESDRCRL